MDVIAEAVEIIKQAGEDQINELITTYEPNLIKALKALNTQSWGKFFFAMPVAIAPRTLSTSAVILPSSVSAANSARVFMPDSDITLSRPPFDSINWNEHGLIGTRDYKGVLVPLKCLKVINPAFDYIAVLHHAVRRMEHEKMVVLYLAEVKSKLKVGKEMFCGF